MENFNPDKVLKSLADFGIKPRGDARGPAGPLVSYVTMRTEERGGAKGGTPELYFTDPDGILMQIQDVTYCGGAGYLGEICRWLTTGILAKAINANSQGVRMKKLISQGIVAALLAPLSFAADVVTAVHGTITKVDTATKTIVVKSADGTEHAVHFVGKTTVHGTDAAAKDTFHGLKEGTEVVAHYTAKGNRKDRGGGR